MCGVNTPFSMVGSMNTGQNDNKITYTNLTDECYRRIKADILSDRLAWGERLDVNGIAEKYGVSRAPVIKSIERLAQEGLVDILPNRGSFVKTPSVKDIVEVSEVRNGFEILACRLAFIKNKALLIQRLEANDQMIRSYEERSKEIPEEVFLNYDRKFHRIFSELAENQRLIVLFDIVRDQIEHFRMQSYAPEKANRSVQMHRNVTARIKNNDLDGALQTLSEHIHEVCQDTIAARSRNAAP